MGRAAQMSLVRASAALLVFALLTATCSKSPAQPSTPSPEGLASRADLDFCVSETNRYRAGIGQPAMDTSAELEAFALAAAQSDNSSGQPHGYFQSHEGNGSENEILRQGAAIFGSTAHAALATAIAGFWSEGPGGPHWQNMAGSRGLVACGVVKDGQLWTIVQEFR